LWEIEDEIFECNIDYICQLENQQIDNLKEEFEELQDFDNSELREEFLGYLCVDTNIKELLNNTNVNFRITINSNYEGFSAMEGEGMENDYIKEVYALLKNHVDKKSFEKEVLNSMMYTQFVFYGNVNLGDVYNYDFKNWKEITIQPGCICGLFDSWNGSGSILEVELTKPITLKRQYGETKYDNIAICVDEAKKYSIMETYGLCGVNNLDFELK